MTDIDHNHTVPLSAERIVADAQESLDAINDRITHLRADKIKLGELIRELLVERKPLLRIVSAAQGRQSHSNGDTE